ncbi:trypsin-2-like [Bacillus rossius redtenbacheri]|uniref:trypsin-2-like n=1 Tax=Bacillus rossius redtenbacheri TaxID=93214 RepID=UPI002FDD683B
MWAVVLLVTLCLGGERALGARDRISMGRDYAEQEDPRFWKIIGGQEATYGEFPFMLALEYEGHSMCGASAIGDYWALTAAHCVHMMDAESMKLRAGSLKRMEGGTLHQVVRAIAHHHYQTDNTMGNDIALLQVSQELTSNKYVKLVSLPSHTNMPLPPGTWLTVCGWGATGSIFDHGLPPTLQRTDVLVLSKQTCQDDPTLSGHMVITDDMICAQEEGHTAYKGDSGGPLFLRSEDGDIQVGVVSWGDFTGQQHHPTIFSRVSSHRHWIRMKSGI